MNRQADPRKLKAIRHLSLAIFASLAASVVAACTVGLTTEPQDAGGASVLTPLPDAMAAVDAFAADAGKLSDAAVVASLCPKGVCDPANPATCANDAEVRSCTLTTAGPACATAGAAAEGSACKVSADCAPGTDCIAAGQCRQYCCDRQCNSDKKFCDVQAKNDARSVIIPVCLPIRQCKLLESPGSCLEGETCAVVSSTGATSCVEIGKAKKDQPCEQEHCVAGNVCLGVGSRKCYQLCGPSKPCSFGEECKSSKPLFTDPAIGICEPKGT